MNTPYYDPYYIIDPALPQTHAYHQIDADHTHADSVQWQRAARAAELRLLRAIPVKIDPVKVLYPRQSSRLFSWRMLAEMMEHAADYAIAHPGDPAWIDAALTHLSAKQYETARAMLDRKLGAEAPHELSALDACEVLQKWFTENWHIIPVVKF